MNRNIALVCTAGALVGVGFLLGRSVDRNAGHAQARTASSTAIAPALARALPAAGGKVESPTGTAPDRYVYYPGTESLTSGEIRLFAAGTGLPAARRGQAATCFLMELGNGDKFLFDIGTGSMANIAALMIPYDMLDKVFLTHLHTDHWGDLATLWAGGWTAGRTGPLKIWGPSGATPEMGTKYAVDHFLKAFNWDAATRNAKLSPKPGRIDVVNSTTWASTRSSTSKTA